MPTHIARRVACLAVAALLAGDALAEADGPDFFRVEGVSPGGTLNMRAEPSVEAPVVGAIPAGAEAVRNLGCEGGLSLAEWTEADAAAREAARRERWCRVRWNGVEGWAAGWLLAESAGGDRGLSGAVAAIVDAARADCEGFEGGAFDAGAAVVELDLTGEGRPAALVDASRFACSSAASMYCGSGGCMLHAVVEDRSWRYQAEGWRMIDWDGRPILLIARDGGWCGGAGAQTCYEAVTWSFGDMLTVAPAAR